MCCCHVAGVERTLKFISIEAVKVVQIESETPKMNRQKQSKAKQNGTKPQKKA